MTRRIGLNPSSIGQLMKIDLAAGGLVARECATRLLGSCPQRVANRFGGRRSFAADRRDLDAVIDDRTLGVRRPS